MNYSLNWIVCQIVGGKAIDLIGGFLVVVSAKYCSLSGGTKEIFGVKQVLSLQRF